jgi:hypothetical protein
MSPSLTPARQTFRAAVADVAARAKALLPQAVNGRVEAAIKLVLAHDVTPQADGSIEVGSSSDPLKVYRLVGTTCDCQDFTRGQAPDGWCQHRIAAGIHKRVQALLEQVPVEMQGPPMQVHCDSNTPLPEAPAPPLARAGMRLEAQVVMDGRSVKVAVWGPDDADVHARLQAVLAQYPLPQPTAPSAASEGQGKDWCAKHQVTMRWNAGKDGKRGWYSHKTAEGWCKGR